MNKFIDLYDLDVDDYCRKRALTACDMITNFAERNHIKVRDVANCFITYLIRDIDVECLFVDGIHYLDSYGDYMLCPEE